MCQRRRCPHGVSWPGRTKEPLGLKMKGSLKLGGQGIPGRQKREHGSQRWGGNEHTVWPGVARRGKSAWVVEGPASLRVLGEGAACEFRVANLALCPAVGCPN